MLIVALSALIALVAASSHSEAPGTAKGPRSDISDLYAFQTVPASDGVQRTALIMNGNGLARSDAGPNYSPVDTNFVYSINIDNDGDAREDISFQFIFGQRFAQANTIQGGGVELVIGGQKVKIPLVVFGQIGVDGTASAKANLFQTNRNSLEYYRVRVQTGDNYNEPLENGPFVSAFDDKSATTFIVPIENVGTKTFPNYGAYANRFNYRIGNTATFGNGFQSAGGVRVPGCTTAANLFVGPRRESFSIDLGRVFDIVNFNPVEGAGNLPHPRFNTLDCNSVLTFAIEVPTSCLTVAGNSVLGIYASVRELDHVERKSGSYHVAGKQTNRLGNPLVNELFIGLPDKDLWSTSSPKDDAQFNNYLKFPTFPQIVQIALGLAQAAVPNVDPIIGRFDILAALHNGVRDVNVPTRVASSSSSSDSSSSRKRDALSSSSDSSDSAPIDADLLRLNTAIAGTAFATENPLSVLQGQFGFPNGRRLGDDIVDIFLRVAMGQVCSAQFIALTAALPAPNLNALLVGNCPKLAVGGANVIASAPLFDRAPISGKGFQTTFPFLNEPIPGNLFGLCFAVADNVPAQPDADQTRVLPQFDNICETCTCGAVPGVLAPLTPPHCLVNQGCC